MFKRICAICVLILLICFTAIGFLSCKGIDNNSTRRTLAEMEQDKYFYFDNEAIALAESIDNTSLRVEAIDACNKVNEIREEAELEELSWDNNLETVASVRAKECSEHFSHTRPDGSEWNTVNSKIQGGENLAFGYDTAEECVDAWMNSPTHKDNILYEDFEKVAISIYEEDGTLYWSQQFSY